MSGNSSSSGGGGSWVPSGQFIVDPLEGKKTRCYAGDGNQLLRLDEGALKVLDLHLGNRERWHLAWAMDMARKVKEAKPNKWTKAFMVEAVEH